MKRALKYLIALVCVLAAYVGTFSYWWTTSQTEVRTTKSGQQIQMHRIRQNNFMACTQPVWTPAFWYMVHVRGYRYHGYIAAYDDSEFLYYK